MLYPSKEGGAENRLMDLINRGKVGWLCSMEVVVRNSKEILVEKRKSRNHIGNI